MTSMFPGHGNPDKRRETPDGRPGPVDYNRSSAGREASKAAGAAWPQQLQWAYYLLLAASVLMVVSALSGFFAPEVPAETQGSAGWEFFTRNRLVVAGVNVVGAVLIGLFAPQLSRGHRTSRRVLAAVIALVAFVNVVAVLLRVGGLILLLIVVLAALAGLLMYRPAASAFIREHDEISWR